MIFHENRLLADDSHEISYFIFRKLEKMSHLSSAAVVIGALRGNKKSPNCRTIVMLSSDLSFF